MNNINSLGGYSTLLFIIAIVITLAILIGAACHYMATLIIRATSKIFNRQLKKSNFISLMLKHHVFQRLTYLIPAIIIYNFADWFNINTTHIKLVLDSMVRTLMTIYVIFGITLVFTAILNCIHDKYKNLKMAKQKPIKSYIQVIKLLLFIAAIILVISIISDKPPVYVLAGLSTLTAVLLLIFRDSILGFVASIQLAAYDMVHIGDNIEMPSFGADGEVIDISLNTVKVQNTDKSIVTIPSYALLSSGIKNWRGMKEAGGRRVKRSVNIDITSIKMCDEKLLQRLSKLELLTNKLDKKIKEMDNYNTKHEVDTSLLANGKQLTNITIFRYYLEVYLQHHPKVHKGMQLSIRQLQATGAGLPIELYFFTNVTDREIYETIQADIMDHIYGVISTFELRMFQYASDPG